MQTVLSKQRPARDILPAHSDDIWEIITQCWAHEPNNRPSTAEVLRSVRKATTQRTSPTVSEEATPVETIENSFADLELDTKTVTAKPKQETPRNYSNCRMAHFSAVFSISTSADGKYIASGCNDGMIWVWNLETGKLFKHLSGHTRWVASVCFSSNGQFIASGSRDNSIRVWNLESGKEVSQPLMSHTDYVTSVSFSPNGRFVVSGSHDKTIRIWDIETGKEIAEPLKGHEDWITSVSFSPDGMRIVSGSWDKTVRLWDLNKLRLASN